MGQALVLADSLYGESSCGFIDVLYELKLDFVVAIQITMQSGYPVGKRFAFDGALNAFSDGRTEQYVIEKFFGKRRAQQY